MEALPESDEFGHSSRVPKPLKMDQQSRKHLLDEPKCIEKGLRKEAGKARLSANGERITEEHQ